MAKLSTDELIDAFKELTLLELSEFVKQFEETFDVTAAAPVAVAAAGPVGGAPAEAEARPGEGQQGSGREGQGCPRRRWRLGDRQVAFPPKGRCRASYEVGHRP